MAEGVITPAIDIKSRIYCASCREERFTINICDCSTCGRKKVKCPKFWSKTQATCELCASKNGQCARCGKPRR